MKEVVLITIVLVGLVGLLFLPAIPPFTRWIHWDNLGLWIGAMLAWVVAWTIVGMWIF